MRSAGQRHRLSARDPVGGAGGAEKDQYILDVLGPHVSKAYISGKEKEWGGIPHSGFRMGAQEVSGKLLNFKSVGL